MVLKWMCILWQGYFITKEYVLHEVILATNSTLLRLSITICSSGCMMMGVVSLFVTILPAKFLTLFSRGKRVPKTVNNGM